MSSTKPSTASTLFCIVSSPSCTWGRSQWKLKPASPGASRGSCSPAHLSTQQSPAGEWVCPCPSLLPTESSPPSPQNPRSSGSPCPPTTPPTHYPRPRDRHPLTGLLTPLHPLHSCRMSAPAPFPFCSLSPSGRQTIHKARGGRSPLLLPRRLLASNVRPPSRPSRLMAEDRTTSGLIHSTPPSDHLLFGQLAPLQPSSTPWASPIPRPQHSVSEDTELARNRWHPRKG